MIPRVETAFPACQLNDTIIINIYSDYPVAAIFLPISTRQLKKYLAAMLTCADTVGSHLDTLELNLVDDAAIARINQEELGVLGPTNIISFPGANALILSLDTFSRECLLYDQDRLEHLIRLLAHGLGHLKGYEHSPEMDMFCLACEKAALSAGGA